MEEFENWGGHPKKAGQSNNTGVAGMSVSPSLLFPRTHIPNAFSSTSHSEICFPVYFVSPPPSP